ncbi:MAG: biopolymer transporter ExbD [Proteobacteria bacterium]|nr:biopolymer transporter ExbD [Pseudomonadota bacterium]
MLGRGRKRRKSEDDVELDMVPIMNMFLVLIPFLLMSASFFHLKAINTSVPVLSNGENNDAIKPDDTVKLTLIVEIKKDGIHLSASSDNAEENILAGIEKTFRITGKNDYPFDEFSTCLRDIKARYPKSDTVIIIPEKSVIYETIIQTMDVARYSKESPMFPKVVLSGKVG